MYFPAKKLFRNALFVFIFAVLSFGLQSDLIAQTKKTTAKTKTTPTKNTTSAKDTKSKISKETVKTAKPAKPSKAELAKLAEQKRLEDARKRELAEKQAAARKAEAARQQAALAEKRRREQVAREARERQQAFERGLKTETQENIANDDTEGEDMEVRKAAVKALGNHAGTVVVMEPQTGKVLTIVNQEWGIRRGFKPCSTIKLVTGVAGLNEKAIDNEGNISAKKFPLNLDDALAHSNNSYFQVVGNNLGSDRLISYAKALGLGEKTGINAENESDGKLPYGNNNARIYSHGDDFEVTPLQLGVMVSALSNGGKIVVPQTPKTRSEQTNFRGYMRREVELPQSSLQRVLPGMIGAVNYGTAQRASDMTMNIAGKTGSCIGSGTWLGLFASVAPVVDPKYAVVVITRGASERGKYASGIAGEIYKTLHRRFTGGTQIAKVPLQLKPQQKANAKTSAKLDNDEGEDADGGDVSKPIIIRNNNPKKGDEGKAGVFVPVIIQVNREPTRPRVVIGKPQ